MITVRPLLISLAAVVAIAGPAVADESIVPTGAVWKYLDDGSNQGTAWRDPLFVDTGWAPGPAQLGYGDGDEATVVSYGPDPNNKYITTYFRHAFTVTDPSAYLGLMLRILRDDGAVAYINGQEVARSNMPAGTIGHLTLASSTAGGAEEDVFHDIPLDVGAIDAGTNVLAVEIHQRSATSSDISFDLELLGLDGPPTVIRGPYLQRGGPDRVVLRWRTSFAADAVVSYGPAPNQLTSQVVDPTSAIEHEVELQGLQPDTLYYYSIGTTGATISSGTDHAFMTAPPAGERIPLRAWVIGDSGTANADAAAVYNAYLDYTGTRYTDLWLMLGDNAYDDGTQEEYEAAVFDMYETLLRQTVVWPTLGNHDGHSADSATESGPYYDIFTLPRAAEIGGVASGTEAYYSFDRGNVHFICLDSYETDRSVGGTMMTWLADDLADTLADWIIAFWHHPPYSKGSHDSDTEGRLVDMREIALPILEAGGVDLVLSGHSHSYERSFLLDGHYGTSGTLTPAMILDAGDGAETGDGPYTKPTLGPGANQGAVYAVAGSSGKISGGALNHPAMVVSLNELGSMVLDFNGDRLDAVFLDDQEAVRDAFTIRKGIPVGDLDLDGVVSVFDLLALLGAWGACPAPCPPACDADLTGAAGLPDCAVDVFDLLELLAHFGEGS